ncbi:MAG: hypothetical protein HQL49_01225 [Gammaproteobacteria bacterium]|nr:hypothetical protein [Gammaproteobacteria bacterium]
MMSSQNEFADIPKAAEIHALYQQSRCETPSPHLDDSIRQQAAAAISKQNKPRRGSRWPISLATAALLVMGLSLTLEQWQQLTQKDLAPAALSSEMAAPRESMTTEDRAKSAPLVAAPAAAPQLLRAVPAMPASNAVLDEAAQSSDKKIEKTRDVAQDAAIEQINALIDAGELTQAAAAIKLFQQHYPDFTLPNHWLTVIAP